MYRSFFRSFQIDCSCRGDVVYHFGDLTRIEGEEQRVSKRRIQVHHH